MAWAYVELYRDEVQRILERVLKEERLNMERAAEEISRALERDGMIYVLGTGHSMLVAAEMFHRAGGLARIYPILETSLSPFSGALKSSSLERLSGYAEILFNYYRISSSDILIVISNSGVNAVPVEAAHEAKKRGVATIAITSVEYSRKIEPRNSLGKRLYEIADITIDNKVPEGDAAIEIKGLQGMKMAPVSTIVNSFIAHSLEILAVEMLMKKNIAPEIWASVNLPRSREINRYIENKYLNRIKHL
jgi:uncharacterized phosphosugar-binding protein